MQNRIVRFTILTVLIIVGIGAGYLSWSAQRESASALARHQQLDSRLDTLLADLAELGAAQQAEAKAVVTREASVVGGAAGAWLLGLVLLSFAPRPRVQPTSIVAPVEQREDATRVNAATGDAALDAPEPNMMRGADSRTSKA